MLFQPRCFGDALTSEQEILETTIFEAAKILRKLGYNCEAVKNIVTKSDESPAYIQFNFKQEK